ncbi:MAG: BrnT family toxin [Pseudomonadota bacterium]
MKHGFDFVDAIAMFDGIIMDKVFERYVNYEGRCLAIGCVKAVVVAVVYTNRIGNRRIISMRKARDYEREYYIEFLTRIQNRLGQN